MGWPFFRKTRQLLPAAAAPPAVLYKFAVVAVLVLNMHTAAASGQAENIRAGPT